MIALYDIAGMVGAFAVIAVFFATQQRWLSAEHWLFPGANLVGAILILISLAGDWNLASFVMEVFWLLISAYGLFRALRG